MATKKPMVLEDIIRGLHPHGHPDFIKFALTEIALHSEKNRDYAGGGNPLGNFERVSKILALYPGLSPSDPSVVALTYLLKHLDAVLWQLAKGNQPGLDSRVERMLDISVYAKIIALIESGR